MPSFNILRNIVEIKGFSKDVTKDLDVEWGDL